MVDPQLPRVFIAPMVGNLDGFLAAEIVKQHVPMRVVTDQKDAQFLLVGLSIKEDVRWYNTKDRNEGNIRLLDVESKTMVWAAEAGDRSLIYNAWRRGGQRKIAERITERMKKQYFDGISTIPQTVSGKQTALAPSRGRALLSNKGSW